MQHDLQSSQQDRLLPMILLCLHDVCSCKRLAMQSLQISDTAETMTIPKWLFPPRFPDKNRFSSSRSDAVLVAPISAKTKKQQTSNEGNGVLRSGRGQLRESGAILQHHQPPPAATSRTTFSRQHRPKDLSILHPT